MEANSQERLYKKKGEMFRSGPILLMTMDFAILLIRAVRGCFGHTQQLRRMTMTCTMKASKIDNSTDRDTPGNRQNGLRKGHYFPFFCTLNQCAWTCAWYSDFSWRSNWFLLDLKLRTTMRCQRWHMPNT